MLCLICLESVFIRDYMQSYLSVFVIFFAVKHIGYNRLYSKLTGSTHIYLP